VTLRERASSVDGLPRAAAPSLSGGRGDSIESARDAVIVIPLIPLWLAVAPASAATHAAGDSVVVLPEVRVEGARAGGEARRRMPTASVTEIEAGAAGRALETLSELLGEAAGVRVQQYGGLGAFSTVSMRGAPPGQVAVFLDGAPLTAAAHNVVNLGDLPATAIERVEVYRGSAPAGMGTAPAGAINLVTLAAPELRTARVSRGAFGTWEARAGAGGRRGAFAGLVHAGHQRSQGDFRYPDDNGTPFNADDDSLSTRVNNRFAATSLLGNATWTPAPGWRLAARGDLFHKGQGVPGLGAVPAWRTHLALTRTLGRLEVSRAGGGAFPTTRLAGGFARERTRFRDPLAELGLGRHDTDDRTGGADVALDLDWRALPRGLSLTAGGALRGERARLADAADGHPDPPESRRLTVSGHAGLQWRPRGERLVLHLAARRERLRDRIHWVDVGGLAREDGVRRTLDAPQAGVRVALPGRLELRANASSARRAPDFLELFGNQGSVLGNPALRPERVRGGDLGLSWSGSLGRGAAIVLDLAHFETRAEDLVVYVRHSQSSVRAENVSRARMSGEELSLRLATPGGVVLTGGLTRMATRDDGPVPHWNGRRLPLRPAAQAYTRLEWRGRRVRAAGDLHVIGADYLDRANLHRVPERLLVGASLSFDPGVLGLRLTVEGKNLGDDRAADVGGFPLPGRAVFAACELRLGPSPSSTP
jgi:iron complex outermembrane receptor protein